MRRFSLLRCGLVAALLTACLSVHAGAASFGVGIVDASALRLRAQPNTSSSILTQAYRGASVEVLSDEADGWYQVSYGGKVGYMSAEHLTVTPSVSAPVPEAAPSEDVPAEETPVEEAPAEEAPAGEAPAEEAPVEEAPAEEAPVEEAPAEEAPVEEAPAEEEAEALPVGQITMAHTRYLNIRAGTTTSSTKLGLVPNGTILPLEEEKNGWYRITYSGVTGYVSGSYVTVLDDYEPTAGSALTEEAMKYVGCAYVYGGSGPNGFDCSGLTSYVYRQFGYSLSRTASGQLGNGVSVAYDALQPGDLVFFKDPSTYAAASHVGIYIGDGKFVHAENSRTGVIVTSLSQSWYASRYIGARRIL